MNIKQVSQKTGVKIDTIRYWEKVGAIPPVARKNNHYRDYQSEDVNWIYLAKQFRAAGISLKALIEYVDLFFQGKQTIPQRKQILIEQRDELGQKIQRMQATYQRLNQKIDGYEQRLLKFEDDKLRTAKK